MEDILIIFQTMSERASLQRLIAQTKPFVSKTAEAIVSLFFTVDRIREVVYEPLVPHGLSGEQYNVLRILRGAGPAGLPTYQVVARMVARSPNITRLTDKLVEKGLLRRVRSSDDRRVSRLVITDEGERILAELDEPIESSTRRALGGLNPPEIEEFLVLLEKIRGPLVGAEEDNEADPHGPPETT